MHVCNLSRSTTAIPQTLRMPGIEPRSPEDRRFARLPCQKIGQCTAFHAHTRKVTGSNPVRDKFINLILILF